MPRRLSLRPGRRTTPARLAVVAAVVALVASMGGAVPALSATPGQSGTGQSGTGRSTTTTTTPGEAKDPGRIAYVTPTGDVVVAESDGSDPKVVGSDAVTNEHGLAPLAWRQPAADAITYVRKDRSLVVAPIDGGTPLILATDAVVPPGVGEDILSWDLTGSFLVYLGEPEPGRVESRVVDLTTANADTGAGPQIRTIGNPERRVVLEQAFSPLDPIIYQRTADVDTGAEFTVAVVEPFSGTIVGSTFSLDDVTFTPDGRYAFAVESGTGDVEQMVRLSMRNPTGLDLVTDHDRICNPAVSPDARYVVFAAGPNCQELWTIRTNGTDPKRIVKKMEGGDTFDVGRFTWSLDGSTISHAACRRDGDATTCGGGYWDISADGRKITARAAAGSVLREQRALLRPVKVQIDITGPIRYSGRIQLGVQSTGVPFANTPDEKIQVKGVDENDAGRSFEIKAIHPINSVWIGGTVRVIDSGFDETFPFVGRVLPYSLGYAKLRGLWNRSETLPMQSGQIVITVER